LLGDAATSPVPMLQMLRLEDTTQIFYKVAKLEALSVVNFWLWLARSAKRPTDLKLCFRQSNGINKIVSDKSLGNLCNLRQRTEEVRNFIWIV